ncbi:hypothetical protein OF83DRAFT_1172165 [Amylostereum chailletii]|nr:hypothetical protein OF83DRAFT_1172165 [Amylostereum chailletii]
MSAAGVTALDGAIASIRRFIPAVVSETGLFGIFTLLFLQSTYILLHKDLRTRSVRWMLVVTGLMYTLSAAHWGTILSGLLTILRHPESTDVAASHKMGIIATATAELSLLLGDAVVVWRVWILWGRNRFVLITCSLLFLSTTAMMIVALYQDATLSPTGRNTLGYVNGIYLGTSAVASFSLSLTTNLWSTALIAYKAWEYRSNISANILQDNRKNMVEKVFTLLMESGALYSSLQVIWITALVFWDSTLTKPFALIMPAVVPQISGIYPTIIIVLAHDRDTPLKL